MFTHYIKFILFIFFNFSSFSLMAFEKGQLNINTGFGIFGSRGVLGISADKFISENHVISFSTALDAIGPSMSMGYKYFDKAFNRPGTGTFLDKCFFLFDCESHPYVGLSLQYASGTKIEFTSENQKRDYATKSAQLGLMLIGFRDVFKNNMTLDLEISNRNLLTGGKIQQTSGPSNSNDISNLKSAYNSFGVGLAIGYLF